MKEYERQGLTKKEYNKVHIWLRTNGKKPRKCTTTGCKENYALQWALIHGKRYEKNAKNFKALCAYCHRSYDYETVYGRTREESNRNSMGVTLNDALKTFVVNESKKQGVSRTEILRQAIRFYRVSREA